MPRTLALCIRHSANDAGSDAAEFTLTEDRNLIQTVARTMLRRFPADYGVYGARKIRHELHRHGEPVTRRTPSSG